MTTLLDLDLSPHCYHMDRYPDGAHRVIAPTAEPDPACEKLCAQGRLARDVAIDYSAWPPAIYRMTYRVLGVPAIQLAWTSEANVIAQVHARGLGVRQLYSHGLHFGVLPCAQTYQIEYYDTATGERVEWRDAADRLGLPHDCSVPELCKRLPISAVDVASAQATRAWLDENGARPDLRHGL